ncbi:hypothetical protein ES703_52638 [subsurface metagenome]
MKAKIRDIGFSPDVIVVGADMFFEEGEAGYDQCWIDVPDYPATEAEPNPPTHKEFVPFRSVSISLPIDATKQQAIDAVKAKLEAFKRAHAKVANAQQWVGTELRL